jgi:hypothetical protein
MIKQVFVAASAGAYKLGLAGCLIHLVLSWWIIISVLSSERDAQWQLIWIFLFPLDFPFSLLVFFAGYIFPDWTLRGLPSPWNDFHSFVLPVIVHGIIGPLWYFLLPVCVDGFLIKRSSPLARSGPRYP